MQNITRGKNKKGFLKWFPNFKEKSFPMVVGRVRSSQLRPFSLGYPIHLESLSRLAIANGVCSDQQSKLPAGIGKMYCISFSFVALFPLLFIWIHAFFSLYFFFFFVWVTVNEYPLLAVIPAYLCTRVCLRSVLFLCFTPVRFTIMDKQSMLNS